MTTQDTGQIGRLKHLFDMELRYTEKFSDGILTENRMGEYIGSGQGSVSGPRIQGQILRWDLYEDVTEVVCRSNLDGRIATNDGAQIKFNTMGFLMIPDKSYSDRWISTAGVQFETDDEQYVWLNGLLGIWEGTFNMATYRHNYRVYVQTPG